MNYKSVRTAYDSYPFNNFRPDDFLDCQEPDDLEKGNTTAKAEQGYGCTKVCVLRHVFPATVWS